MNSALFWSLMSSLIVLPLTLGYLLSMTDVWRCTLRTRILLVVPSLCCAAVIDMALFLLHGGSSSIKSNLVMLDLLFALCIFLLIAPWQRGRTLFALATSGLCIFVVSAILSIFSLPYDGWRVLLKAGGNLLGIAVFWRYFRPCLLGVLPVGRSMWYKLSLVPLAYFFAFGVSARLRVIDGATPSSIGTVACNIAFLMMFASSYISFAFILRSIRRAALLRHDNTMLNAQIEVLQKEAASDAALHARNAAFHAEMENALDTIGAALDGRGDAHAALGRLSEGIRAAQRAGAVTRHTGNALIDSLLSDFCLRAAQEGVCFDIAVRLPETDAIDVTGLAVVLANGLENALTACAALPPTSPRRICLMADTHGRQFLLQITNPFAGHIRFDPTTRCPVSARDGHGYGTQSIAAYVHAQGGQLEFLAADGVFTLRIVFSLENQPQKRKLDLAAIP